MECRKFKRCFATAFAVALVGLCSTFGFAQTQNPTGFSNQIGSRIAPGMVNDRGEEIVGRPSGFSAVLTLDDQKLKALFRNGRVEINIPNQLVNSVDSFVVKRPIYFKEKTALDFADAELVGQRLVLTIDRSVIERIDYQPVELKVYESGFTSVVLRYAGESLKNQKAPGDPDTDSPLLTVKLKSGKGISGRIRGMRSLNLDSILGMITIEFSRSRKINVKQNGDLNVEMLNGDLISGSIDGGKIVLVNRWGNETIKLSDIATLTMNGQKKPKAKRNVAPAMEQSAMQPSQSWTLDRGVPAATIHGAIR